MRDDEDAVRARVTEVAGARLAGFSAREDGITVVLDIAGLPARGRETLRAQVDAVARRAGAAAVRIVETAETTSEPAAGGRSYRVLAVGAGKGGVGKSTVAANLAVAMARMGLRVGLLDADIHGPSLPTLLGVAGVRAEATADKRLTPVVAHGVGLLSIGLMASAEAAVAWRGPMIAGAVMQMADSGVWGDIDLLVVDLPPGTGDIALAVAQKLKPDAALLVTQPRELSLVDTARAAGLFRTLGVPIAGVVVNMVGAVFGMGEGVAERLGGPVLAVLPLDAEVADAGDAGTPPAAGSGEGADRFRRLGALVAERLQEIARATGE